MELKDQLKKMREERGLSKTAVASGSSIPYTTYIKYEYGEREVGIKQLQLIANFYGISTDYLLGRELSDDETELQELRKKEKLKELEEEIVKKYLELDEVGRGLMLDFIKKNLEAEKAKKGISGRMQTTCGAVEDAREAEADEKDAVS